MEVTVDLNWFSRSWDQSSFPVKIYLNDVVRGLNNTYHGTMITKGVAGVDGPSRDVAVSFYPADSSNAKHQMNILNHHATKINPRIVQLLHSEIRYEAQILVFEDFWCSLNEYRRFRGLLQIEYNKHQKPIHMGVSFTRPFKGIFEGLHFLHNIIGKRHGNLRKGVVVTKSYESKLIHFMEVADETLDMGILSDFDDVKDIVEKTFDNPDIQDIVEKTFDNPDIPSNALESYTSFINLCGRFKDREGWCLTSISLEHTGFLCTTMFFSLI